MTYLGFVYCDLCKLALGQLWNQPVVAADALPTAPDFHVCGLCTPMTASPCPQPFAEQKEGGRGQ